MIDAEIVSVGDELTSGQRLDTNSQWLSQRLGELGVRTIRHTTVGDDLAANVDAFRQAAGRARLVVISGGLGPTLDDLTREALAAAFELPLEMHQPSLDHIANMFARRQRPMPDRNRVQALFPAGSQPIPNPHGTAPGIDLSVISEQHASRVFALPGVPAELKQMWSESVAPRIESELGDNVGPLRFHSLKVYGIGESDVEVKLPTLIARTRIPTVGITVSRATITLRIAERSRTAAEFHQLIAPTVAEIQAALGDLIFGEGEDELEQAVSRQLLANQMTLASVEVGASSLIADWMLGASEDADRYFAGGIAFPTLARAQMWLRGTSTAPTEPLEPNIDLFSELSELVRTSFNANVGVACGIYPTAEQLSNSARVFDVLYAVSIHKSKHTLHTQRLALSGHPEVVTARIAKTALDIVRRRLSELT